MVARVASTRSRGVNAYVMACRSRPRPLLPPALLFLRRHSLDDGQPDHHCYNSEDGKQQKVVQSVRGRIDSAVLHR